jgi:regulator of protease activity HflC (stomatin/prohibitin superfamily)
MSGLTKLLIIIGALLVSSLIFVGCTTTRVDVGHVGVKVKLAGSGRGVQDMQIKTGWVIYNPLTEQVVEFPVNVQNIILSSDPHEGGSKDDTAADHSVDESITFSSIEGVNATANVGFSFHIDPSKAPQLYARFKQTDMRELAYGYMRNVIREGFSEIASKMPIQDIYGAGKTKLVTDVSHKCQEVLGKDGIVIDQLTINGALKLPENVAAAINNAMAATQNAIQSENKVRQIKAEAEQTITTAHGAAEAARQKAQGEADALLISSKAEAEARGMAADAEYKANNLIQSSLTPQILRFRSIQKWDGKLPVYFGATGPTPMISVQ